MKLEKNGSTSKIYDEEIDSITFITIVHSRVEATDTPVSLEQIDTDILVICWRNL